ncbi:MAG: serine/threonine-protein kinase [Polyangiaceae bacterium]|nr:serine/threonine-protein kinase [Polyangiaceae bacterium]
MSTAPPLPVALRMRVGEVVAGRYSLLSLIDRGGQGAVYRARDIRGGDEVAVKILGESLVDDPQWRERMFREARALTELVGTAAVRILDQTYTDDGAICIVMELLHGRDFEEYLRGFENEGFLFPVEELVQVMDPIVDTLELAHSRGIVHRDLKPGNLYLADGVEGMEVRLLDFGFAKFLRMPSVTHAGMVAGSPSYIAPESWKGQTPDHRVDVYGVGAIVFRALAGSPPFYSTSLGEMLDMVTRVERPSLLALRTDLPVAIDAWVARALCIDRDERYQTVRELWAALSEILGVHEKKNSYRGPGFAPSLRPNKSR